ncbi:MAG TPA: AAA family ATPase, partial [Candidatus Polarisedimenticolia bacterium]
AIGARRAETERLASQGAAAEERRRDLEGMIRSASEELAARRAEIEEVQRRSAEAHAVAAAGQERRSSLVRERQAQDAAIAELQTRAERGAALRQEWAARVVSLREEGVSLAAAIEAALSRRAAAAERNEAGAAGLAYDRSLLHSREQAAKEGRTAHDALRRELQGAELHLARLDSDLRHLEAVCRDDLATTLDVLRAAAPPAAAEERALADDEAEIEAIKTDLEGIGPVNLMAIEQYTELEERFNFLNAQKTDLETSIASLRDTIRKINRESRERFLTAFEAIQLGFALSFTTLFGGGRAELRLEEGEEDVLEAGIEIAAQPPGKRLQSIALLSGGEKALTAVALLFALFRYRPSPFCVLDEVDAPLDEANVERFTRLLRGLREETQFIVITHNRKSMEAADLLYGVTMEEPGVSKVLPLRFE